MKDFRSKEIALQGEYILGHSPESTNYLKTCIGHSSELGQTENYRGINAQKAPCASIFNST